jgi:hypothetical protein
MAKQDGISMNQFMATAIAEKISALETSDFFNDRLKRLNDETFDRVMSRTGGEPPRKGDEVE